jgi:tRNA threonylcarbamoyladenosine biosynthesis protein TsaE
LLKIFKCLIRDLEETRRLGKVITQFAQKSATHIITLEGNLGVGKTTLSKSIISSYLEQEIVVTSPTFTLLNIYENAKGQVYHCDLYRLKHANELLELGIEEAICTKSLILIEWPSIAQNYLQNLLKIEVKLFFNNTQEQRSAIVQLSSK